MDTTNYCPLCEGYTRRIKELEAKLARVHAWRDVNLRHLEDNGCLWGLDDILSDTAKPIAVFDAATDEGIVWPDKLGDDDWFSVEMWSPSHAGEGSAKFTVIVMPKEGD